MSLRLPEGSMAVVVSMKSRRSKRTLPFALAPAADNGARERRGLCCSRSLRPSISTGRR